MRIAITVDCDLISGTTEGSPSEQMEAGVGVVRKALRDFVKDKSGFRPVPGDPQSFRRDLLALDVKEGRSGKRAVGTLTLTITHRDSLARAVTLPHVFTSPATHSSRST